MMTVAIAKTLQRHLMTVVNADNVIMAVQTRDIT